MRAIINRKIWLFVIAAVMAMSMGCAQGDGDEDTVVVGNPVDVEELTGQNLTEFHINAAFQNNSLCIACHGDKSWETSTWDPGIAAPHKIHHEFTQLTCVDCHQSVDLLQFSGAALRKQVSTETCAQCHGVLLFPGL